LEFFDELPILVEDLNSLVLPVRHPELAFAIESQSVRDIKFTRLLALPAPGFDELSVLVELQDAWVTVRAGSVTLSNKDVTIIGNGDIVRLIQKLRRFVPFTALALGAQRHQNFSLWV